MAVNRTPPLPKRFAYYPRYYDRLRWKKVEDVPGPYNEYWHVYYDGRWIGDFFQGKTGYWYVIVFGRTTVWHVVNLEYAMHTAALLAQRTPKN
jgi:hypothetical protein